MSSTAVPNATARTARRVARIPDVIAKTGLSRPTIYRLEAQGRFPKHIKLGERACGWFVDEIDDWLETRAAQREGSPIVGAA
jgi:prophage regulatory protein